MKYYEKGSLSTSFFHAKKEGETDGKINRKAAAVCRRISD